MTSGQKIRLSNEIEKMLENNNVYGICVPVDDFFEIEISWGDWKHEHAKTDWIMMEAGFRVVDVFVTEDDGSDCYSAVHRYERV